MNSPMRVDAGRLDPRGDVDEHERPRERGGPVSAIAASDAMPPSDAPMSTGGSASDRAIGTDVARDGVERVVAVGRPVAVAVAAQVDAVRPPACSAEHCDVVPHAWRVCPPPCSSTTGGAEGSPSTSATSEMPLAPLSEIVSTKVISRLHTQGQAEAD